MGALTENEAKAFSAEPGDRYVGLVEVRSQQERVVGALLEGHDDLALVQGDRGPGMDEVVEEVS